MSSARLGWHGCGEAQSQRLTPATAPGAAALSPVTTALARAPAAQLHDEATHQEILVTAQRQSDAVPYSERGADAAGCHLYISAHHRSAVTEKGIVRLLGVALDANDLHQVLARAGWIAGRRHVANEVEFIPLGADHN